MKQEIDDTTGASPSTNNSSTSRGAVPKQTRNATGKIVNLISNDMGNVIEGRLCIGQLFQSPLQIGVCVAFLYGILGYA